MRDALLMVVDVLGVGLILFLTLVIMAFWDWWRRGRGG